MLGQRLLNRVRERRDARGISIDELSRISGVGRTTIGAVERYGTHPSGTVMLRLAEALGTTVQDLFWSEPAGAEPVEAAS